MVRADHADVAVDADVRKRRRPTSRSISALGCFQLVDQFIALRCLSRLRHTSNGIYIRTPAEIKICSHRGYLMSRSTISTFQRDVSRPGNREGLESRSGRTASAAPGGSRERITTRGRLLSLQSVQGFHRPHRHDFRAVACPAARGFMRCTRRHGPYVSSMQLAKESASPRKPLGSFWDGCARLAATASDKLRASSYRRDRRRRQEANKHESGEHAGRAGRRTAVLGVRARRLTRAVPMRRFDSDVFMMKFASTSSRRYDEFAVSLAGFSTKPSTTALEYVAMTLRRTASRMSLPCSSAASTARSTISPVICIDTSMNSRFAQRRRR